MRHVMMPLEHLPNIMSSLRIVGAVALLLCDVVGTTFWALYALCGISDIADGGLARKLKCVTKSGALLDSVADICFVACCAWKLLSILELPQWLWLWAGVIVAIKVVNQFSALVMYGRCCFPHTTANKWSGFLLFIAVPMTFWSIAPITIVASVATFAAIHENYFIRTRNNMRKIVTLVCALVVTSCWAQEPISDSTCKALMDRTVSFNSPLMYVDSDGIAHHYGYEEGTKKTVLISTAGLPNMKGNFDGLLFAMRHMYGKNISYICCAEGSLFLSPDTESLTVPYLEKVKQAGAEYKTAEKISDETQAYLDTPMLPAETFVKTVNGIFESMMK